MPPPLLPAFLSDQLYRVLAWVPANNADGSAGVEAAAVCYRHDPECADAPYVVWRARRRTDTALPADAPVAWRLDLGVYDLAGLNEAMQGALLTAEWYADGEPDHR